MSYTLSDYDYTLPPELIAQQPATPRDSARLLVSGASGAKGGINAKDYTFADLPSLLKAGDILAMAGCGAYSIPQSSNYNAFFLPAIVLVKDGKARLIRRRQTLEDLTRCDLV